MMEYKEVRQFLESMKQNLENKMHDASLSQEEKEEILKSIVNYEYIIELTDMNHFERGSVHQ
ncbi:DUF3896 domain-containing protein [Mesobacillus maritimus]|uniref:DUF3896 family protein n=1 Tax=Mesobacillus maritimus TaxID=1643336 RepID=UPI00203ACB6D|nr:DUF3896 family protein [Mesobacillus maritimus]MCM3586602.1 DUF3896 domain-containing protein [Mesobacillus maritimus]MCM3668644.1 DUF3896 domain-containing protein [Mesobacillus maritimus]